MYWIYINYKLYLNNAVYSLEEHTEDDAGVWKYSI
jgi:hypothetical protein